jgi:pimeloyl-ACP methyl ester carboxylesterase
MTIRALLVATLAMGCVQPQTPGGGGGGDGEVSIEDAILYRDNLGSHPGCSTASMSYTPGSIPGYQCALKAYPGSFDSSKPIVLLIHGNSDAPDSWERWPKDSGEPMVAETLVANNFETYAIDLRIDLNDDPQTNNDTENAARNIDHGWSTPIAQHLIEATMDAFPERKITIIGFSLGVTITRDALRRLHLEGKRPWAHLQDVITLAGANHGVSTYARLCGKNPTMRGQVACELGPRDAFSPTDFIKPLNGKAGAYETPCADGTSAFGDDGACEGHQVSWTTVVMRDISDGSYQDEFVSEASSHLDGADNRLIDLTDVDESGYFFNGLLKNHYGAARSQAALGIITEVVLD